MHTLLPTIRRWQAQGKAVALVTLVQVYGSAPQPLGAKMVVSATGEMEGSVSGGCVEGAVAQEAMQILKTSVPKLIPYGIADELAQSVGLACGGAIEVFIEPLAGPVMAALLGAVERAEPVSVAKILARQTDLGSSQWGSLLFGDRLAALGTLGDPTVDDLARSALAELGPGNSARRLTLAGAEIFIERILPPARLIIVGAVHIAQPLVTFGNELGFHTVVIDARAAFATPERFGHAKDLRIGWPADILAQIGLDENSYIVVLSHDEKLDNPALAVALAHPVAYIGALGSRRTHAKRVDALTELGVTPAQIARIHAPIGLDLGGRHPAEIAVAIMAEIVGIKNRTRI